MPRNNSNNTDDSDVEGELIISHGASARGSDSSHSSKPNTDDDAEGEIFIHDPPAHARRTSRSSPPKSSQTDKYNEDIPGSTKENSSVPKLHPFNFKVDDEWQSETETPEEIAKPGQNSVPGQTTTHDDPLLGGSPPNQRTIKITRKKVLQVAGSLMVVALSVVVTTIIFHLVHPNKKNNTAAKNSQTSSKLQHNSLSAKGTQNSGASNYTTTSTFTNNGYAYTVLFDKGATVVTSGGIEHLSGYDLPHKVELVVIAYLNSYQSCRTEYPTAVVVFNATIQGNTYPVCSDVKKDTMFANFEYKNVWQRIAVYSKGQTSPVDVNTAKTIFNSLTVK